MMIRAQCTRLPNGLRVATAAMPHVESVSMGVWVGAGGRCEPARWSGISHFIEHLLFKGTPKRSARAISQTIEGRGGDINAFTQEETTCYYARVAADHAWEALDVLLDMYLHPRFAAEDLRRERDVVIEEIMMVRDQPHQQVDEMLGELLWRGHPLGRPLTGSPETVGGLDRKALTAYRNRFYVPVNTVVAFAGQVDHAGCVARVQRYFAASGGMGRHGFDAVGAGVKQKPLWLKEKDIEQAHLAMGFRLFGRHDRRRYALKLLSVILGENMSSRLFQTVREDHGLAYAIQSGVHLFEDTGILTVSAGLDRERLGRALRLIVREIGRMRTSVVPRRELDRARDYAIGQLRLGLEGSNSQMMWVGEHLMSYGRMVTPESAIAEFKAVTAGQVRDLARQCLREDCLSVAMILPGLTKKLEAEAAGIMGGRRWGTRGTGG
jgi:predicted Zn-dependent peptidase